MKFLMLSPLMYNLLGRLTVPADVSPRIRPAPAVNLEQQETIKAWNDAVVAKTERKSLRASGFADYKEHCQKYQLNWKSERKAMKKLVRRQRAMQVA